MSTARAKIMKNVPTALTGNNPDPNARKAAVRTSEEITRRHPPIKDVTAYLP
jgi:hypothetical protein